jgi:PAS domain S-box-containing protein
MALLIVAELGALYFAVSTLSSVRAYVQAEGLYSKAQKDAVYHLMKYASTYDENDFIKFRIFMMVPQGDRQARMELYNKNPDMDLVRDGYLRGRNHPDDINGMVKLFRRFNNIYFVNKAISLWEQADSVSARLLPLGDKLHAEISSGNPNLNRVEELQNLIHSLNQNLTILVDNFSYTLGEGSRWLEKFIFTLLFFIALSVETTGLILGILLTRGIAKGIDEIVRVSESVAGGDFSVKATVYSKDEIGKLARAFNHMTDQLDRSRKERMEADKKQMEINVLRQTEKRFRNTIEAVPNALLMINLAGRIRLVNRQAEKLFMYKREELIQMDFKKLLPAKFHDTVPSFWIKMVEEHFDDDLSETFEISLVDREGREFPAEVGINQIETEGELMLLASMVDVTKRKSAEIELVEAKNRAEKLSMARQEFLSVMSHEMRTPLNAVVGISHLLMEDELSPEQKENVNILQFSAQNLLALINNILDFSKIEAGKLQLESIEFDLYVLVKRIIDSFWHNASEKQINLFLDYDIRHTGMIKGDPVRLTQVLTNLVHNAIKFTSHGEVRLKVEAISSTDSKIIIRFTITDTGSGIENSRLTEIFDSYTQAKPSITRQFGGTGLGLTICKKLVEMMGGKISVKSELNKGSVFKFSLGFAFQSPSEQKVVKPHHEKDFDLKGVKVLLVEDNIINQVLAKKFITRWGAVVDTAENGMIAVRKVRGVNYDIVLMDLQMPVIDGYNANRIIREMGYTYDKLPVIALSAYMLEEVKSKIRQAGMNDYLSKPIDPHELYRIIVKNLKRKRRMEDDAPNDETGSSGMDLPELLASFDDPVFRNQFLDMLETEFRTFIPELNLAVKELNSRQVHYLIHRIHPSLKRFRDETLSPLLVILKMMMDDNPLNPELRSVLPEIDAACQDIIDIIRELRSSYIY